MERKPTANEKLLSDIDELSSLADIYYCDGMTDRSATIRRAIFAMRELYRLKNMTCRGCEFEMSMMGVTRCDRCRRFPLLSDRYKSKGVNV